MEKLNKILHVEQLHVSDEFGEWVAVVVVLFGKYRIDVMRKKKDSNIKGVKS